MDKLTDIIAPRCRWLAAAAIISVVVPLYFVAHIKTDNSIEVWLKSNSSEYRTYRSFLERYESEEFIVIAANMDNPFSDNAITLQQRLAEELRDIKGVARVIDLPGVCSAIWENKQLWQNQAKNSKFLSNLLLSKDGQTIGIFVWLERFENPGARRQTVEAIETAVSHFAGREFEPHLAGTPLMNVELDRGSQKASATFLPIALGISVLVLVFMLRSVSGVIAPMCAVGATTAWTVGIMAMTGRTLNMVTVVLPSLLFILSLSNGIHITSRFFDILARVDDHRQAVKNVLQELIRPIFLSSITTSVGFASLMISDMKPVADFGLYAAIGMLLSFLFNLLIVPGVLSLFHARHGHTRGKLKPHWSSTTGALMVRRRRLVLIVSVFALVGCGVAATTSTVESNVLKFFPEDSRISRDYTFIGQKLTGFYTVELEVRTEESDEYIVLESIERLAEVISNRQGVARVLHYGDTVSLMNSFDPAIFGVLGAAEPAKLLEDMLGRYRLKDDGIVSLRMSVLINAMASSGFYNLLNFIETEADKIFGQSASYNITGVVPLLNDVQKSLIDTQIQSFSIAATIILVMIGLFMRSLRAALASVLPNLLPVFAMFAFMALFKIPLNAATVMIASVAIGIAADDTIHFLSHYRHEKRAGLETVNAVSATFGKIGRAIVFTSIVTAAGFSILCFAQFRPIVYFGIMTGITMLAALAGDLFVLPACVRVFKLWEKK